MTAQKTQTVTTQKNNLLFESLPVYVDFVSSVQVYEIWLDIV